MGLYSMTFNLKLSGSKPSNALKRSKKYCLHSNFTNYNNVDNPQWDGSHNDYLFVDVNINQLLI